MTGKRLFFMTLVDTAESPYGESILPALAQNGWQITVAAVSPHESITRKISPYACETLDLGQNKLIREVRVFLLMLWARVGPFDVIHLHSHGLAVRTFPAMLGPLFGKALVYQTLELIDPARFPWRVRIERWLCRRAHLHMGSEYHRAYMYWSYYRLRCPVLVAPPRLAARWPIPEPNHETRRTLAGDSSGAFVLICHGGFALNRVTATLLQALSLLPDRFRLAMTNSQAPKADMEALIERLRIADRLLRLPRLDMQAMLAYTVNADAGVLLYRNSDIGNFFTSPGRLTEYTACGLPVLASDFTGLQSLVTRLRIGECVDASRAEDVASAVLKLELSVKNGEYDRARIRGVFLKHLAFDNFEGPICSLFDARFKCECGKSSPPTRNPEHPC